MKVVGYFPNSHFFNILQKYAIDRWNSKIDLLRGKKDLYVLKSIQFINRKTVLSKVDTKREIFIVRSSAKHLEDIGTTEETERAKINIKKKNYQDVGINETLRVDETFDFDG
mmetsp:Transcript_22013/g.19569  ORF Transcript_22013/g.19569 Transcript_22013/m.19569 type:complete len:112 (-) Transcript_22013:886-1221(-)